MPPPSASTTAIAGAAGGWRRRLTALRRWLLQDRSPVVLPPGGGPAASPVLPVGRCCLQGVFVAPPGSSAILELGFLAAGTAQAQHAVDLPLDRPGRFEARVFVPSWCAGLCWSLRGPPGDTVGEVRLTRLRYLGALSTLGFVAAEVLHFRPLLHWMWWWTTRHWPAVLRRWLPARRPDRYARWRAATEPDPQRVAGAIDGHRRRMREQPDFTVLVDASDASSAAVQHTVDSVLGQLWPHWQLVILGSGSIPGLPPDRFRVCPPRAMAACCAEARTTYLLPLCAGDRLSPLALYALATAHEQEPGCVLIHADEDRLDARGRRQAPRLKPQWNPELLESHDYLGVPTALRTEALRRCGGWRDRFGDAARFDALLRLTAGQPAARVRHVPLVACSRPQHRVARVDPPAAAAALAEHLEHAAPGARVEPGLRPGWLRVRRALPDPLPPVSVIVPTRDGDAHLRSCVDSLLGRTDYPALELLLVDNQSRHAPTLAYLAAQARDPRVRLLAHDAPFNFAAICNLAARQARGEVLLLLNDDTEVLHADWLREMVSHAIRPEVGAVGAKLYFPDGTLQHGGVGLGIGGVAAHLHWGAPGQDDGYLGRLKAVQAIGAVTGACLAVTRDKYHAVGGMDEVHLHVALNDIDLCLKLAERGWRSVWTPHARLRHHESKSRGRDSTAAKRALFAREHATMRRRWATQLDHDPYYPRGLTRHHLDLRLAEDPPAWAPWEAEPGLGS